MKAEYLVALGRVSTTQLALESLRAKDTDRALELLELDLDASVLALNRLAKEADPTERERFISVLRQIRAYRRVHPRRAEADLRQDANGLLVRAARGAKDRVQKILDELS